MTSKRGMIEYTMYVIDNNASPNQIIKLFKDRNIVVDHNYTNSILKLQELYTQIINTYKGNIQKVNQFVLALKNSLKNNEVHTFAGFPPAFKNFYSLFSNLVGTREEVIKYNLRVIDDIVIKYDYYFEKKFIQSKKIDEKDPFDLIVPAQEFVLLCGETDHIIWNMKTDEIKEFSVDIVINIKPKYLGQGRFVVQGFSSLSILDFTTNKQTDIRIDEDDMSLNDFQLTNNKIIIASDKELVIMDKSTLEVKERFDVPNIEHILYLSHTFKDDVQMITTSRTDIHFWNQKGLVDKLSVLVEGTGQYIVLIRQMGNILLAAFPFGRVEAFDLNTRKSLWFKSFHIADVLDIIVRHEYFIVHYRNSVVILDMYGNIKDQLQHEGEVKDIFVLPDNQIIFSSEGEFEMWNLQTRETDEALQHYSMNVSQEGKIIVYTRDYGIKVYK